MKPLLLSVLLCALLLGAARGRSFTAEAGVDNYSDRSSPEAHEPGRRPQPEVGRAQSLTPESQSPGRPCCDFPKGPLLVAPCRLVAPAPAAHQPPARDPVAAPDASCRCPEAGRRFHFLTPEQLFWCRAR
jgi:hypothetical protein